MAVQVKQVNQALKGRRETGYNAKEDVEIKDRSTEPKLRG